jgi:hypothetical protein
MREGSWEKSTDASGRGEGKKDLGDSTPDHPSGSLPARPSRRMRRYRRVLGAVTAAKFCR